MISQRIKAALAAAEARGVVLGNPSLATAREHAVKARVAGADRRATRGRMEPHALDRPHATKKPLRKAKGDPKQQRRKGGTILARAPWWPTMGGKAYHLHLHAGAGSAVEHHLPRRGYA
jgi:hypothetical protein